MTAWHPSKQKSLYPPIKKLAASRINTGTAKMKMFEYVFEALGTTAAVAISLGAYWHIFTLGACALMVWSLKAERKKNKQSTNQKI